MPASPDQSLDTVLRYDTAGEMTPAHRRSDGTMLFEGRAARVGILEYRDARGTVTRELVPPETLFAEDAMASLARAPLTLLHPPQFVTPDNVEKFQVGDTDGEVLAEQVTDGGFVRIRGAIRRRDALDAVDRDGVRELSVGYTATLDRTPGVWRGQHYDAVQTSRLANHIALVPRGRAGHEVALRVDSADAVMIGGDAPREEGKMADRTASVEIGGVRYDGLDPTLAQAVATIQQQKADADAQSAQSVSKMQAQIDMLQSELSKRDEQIEQMKADMAKMKDAAPTDAPPKCDADDAAFLARVNVLLPLRALATDLKVDGADGMLEGDLRRAILAAEAPSVKLDGRDDTYIEAAVDVLMDRRQDAETAAQTAARAAAGLRSDGSAPVADKPESWAQKRQDAEAEFRKNMGWAE